MSCLLEDFSFQTVDIVAMENKYTIVAICRFALCLSAERILLSLAGHFDRDCFSAKLSWAFPYFLLTPYPSS